MYATPAKLLNSIAATTPLMTQGCRALFRLPQDQLWQMLDSQVAALEARGVPPEVAMLYVKIGPLLAENQAISRYILQTGNSSLRTSLPEVTSLQEALRVADLENPMLTSSMRRQLAMLLQKLVPPKV